MAVCTIILAESTYSGDSIKAEWSKLSEISHECVVTQYTLPNQVLYSAFCADT